MSAAETKLAVATTDRFFTPEQEKMLREMFLAGASDAESRVLIEIARARRLSPFLRQIYFRKQWDSESNSWKWIAIVAIDGFRSIAEDTGQYDGQDEPVFAYGASAEVPTECKVSVWRKGIARPFVGVAHFKEYVQLRKDKTPNRFWGEKPHIMLAKCAESLAFRKAFPQQLSGIYAPEEIGMEEKEVNSATSEQKALPLPSRTQTLKAELKQRLGVTDAKVVPVGETPWGKLMALGEKHNVVGAALGALIRSVTGKTKQNGLDDNDVALVEAALTAESEMNGTEGT